MSDQDRPMRAKIQEWARSEDRITQESGVGACAIIEAMDAQTAAIQLLAHVLESGLDAIGKPAC